METLDDWADAANAAFEASEPKIEKWWKKMGWAEPPPPSQMYVIWNPEEEQVACHLCGRCDHWVHLGDEKGGYFACIHDDGVASLRGLVPVSTVTMAGVGEVYKAEEWSCPECGGEGEIATGCVTPHGVLLRRPCPYCQPQAWDGGVLA